MAVGILDPKKGIIWSQEPMTPDQIAKQKLLAEAIIQRAGDTSPVQSWTQGAARVVDALGGVLRSRRADKALKAGNETAAADFANAMGNTSFAPSSAPSAPSGIPMSGAATELQSSNPSVATAPQDIQSLIAEVVPQDMQAYATNLVGKESSFNPNAVSPTGATGLAQFTKGTGRQYGLINDAGDFRADPRANLNALVRLTNDNRQALTQALGRAPTDGELALAHQQGAQGAIALLSGQNVPAANLSVNGVNPNSSPQDAAAAIMKYYGGSAGAPVQTQAQSNMQMAQAAPQPQGGNQEAILKALQNPFLSRGQQAVLGAMMQQQQARQQALYEQQLKQSDPAYQLGLQKDQITLDQLRNPPEPDSVRALKLRAQAAGLEPGTQQYTNFMVNGGASPSVNIDTGTIPTGYQAIRDPQGRVIRYDPVPGGPADNSQKATAMNDGRETITDVVTNAANLARKATDEASFPTSGIAGRIAGQYFPSSNAAEVRRQVNVLKSNATIENLNAMRQQSPTGGALGSVTESENAMLAAKAGALDPDSPSFQRDLDDYERTLLRTIHGKAAGDKIYDATRPVADTSNRNDTAPEGIDADIWSVMTPEEKSLWQKR